jgi:hypothetical protein
VVGLPLVGAVVGPFLVGLKEGDAEGRGGLVGEDVGKSPVGFKEGEGECSGVSVGAAVGPVGALVTGAAVVRTMVVGAIVTGLSKGDGEGAGAPVG